MCKTDGRERARAFWSIDAAFALVLSVAMFAMFSSMLYAAGMMAAGGADETSGVLLSARFSSYALARMEEGRAVDLQYVLGHLDRKYASLRIDGNFTDIGNGSGGTYCTRRLYVHGGRMAVLEACIG